MILENWAGLGGLTGTFCEKSSTGRTFVPKPTKKGNRVKTSEKSLHFH